MHRGYLRSATAAIGLLTLSFAAAAQEPSASYPSKPITFVVPFTPGGSSDLMARTLAPLVAEQLSGSVVIENRPGATATLATGQVARAPADGYTIIIDPVGIFTLQPLLREVPYKVDDFRGIAGLSTQEIVLAVNASNSAATASELVEAAKAAGRAVVYGSSGTVGFPHIAQAALLKEAGVEGRHIAYEGSAQALTALLGGHIEMVAVHPPEALPHVQSGALKVIGVFSAERLATLPDVETIGEQGFEVGEFAVWNSVLAPAGVSDAIATELSEAFQWAMTQPAWQDTAAKLNFTPYPISGEEVMERLRAESSMHGDLLTSLGLKP